LRSTPTSSVRSPESADRVRQCRGEHRQRRVPQVNRSELSALGGASLGFGAIRQRQYRRDTALEAPAGRCQRNVALVALEQARAHFVLERLDLGAQ
jgi:hypothetical protein